MLDVLFQCDAPHLGPAFCQFGPVQRVRSGSAADAVNQSRVLRKMSEAVLAGVIFSFSRWYSHKTRVSGPPLLLTTTIAALCQLVAKQSLPQLQSCLRLFPGYCTANLPFPSPPPARVTRPDVVLSASPGLLAPGSRSRLTLAAGNGRDSLPPGCSSHLPSQGSVMKHREPRVLYHHGGSDKNLVQEHVRLD